MFSQLKQAVSVRPDGDYVLPDLLRYRCYRMFFGEKPARAKAAALAYLLENYPAKVYEHDLVAGSRMGCFVPSSDYDRIEAIRARDIAGSYGNRHFTTNADHFAPGYDRFLADGISGTLGRILESIEEYQQSKENVNGCYGMTVTDICRDEINYIEYFEDDQNVAWTHTESDYEKMINKYNRDKKRFLYYPWGLFVTSHARKIIWDAILECKEDYRYSDTDSVKFTNYEKHKQYFIDYNHRLLRRLKKVMEILNIPFEKCTPKTIEGKIKPIGVFDYEGTYKRFKYLGAKRYLYEDQNNELHLTVSGVNKFVCVPYLLKTYKDNTGVFNAFNDGLIIPKGYTGKQIHTYIDYETKGIVRDYLGKEYEYHELSGIHMEDTEYSLSMSEEFLRYLLGTRVQV